MNQNSHPDAEGALLSPMWNSLQNCAEFYT